MGIIPRPPYQPETQSRSDMGRGMIAGINNDDCDNRLTIKTFGNEFGTGLSEIIYGRRSREL